MNQAAPHILTVTDNRTGKSYNLPVQDGNQALDESIDASFFQQLGLSIYDNGYLNTAICKSSITFIDGDKGILRYRGYNIQDLAEKSTFLEVSYLLIYGELPNKSQLEAWTARIMRHTFIHENMTEYLKSFRVCSR